MSFGTHARRVSNASLSLGARHVALRSCVERFCPLGFRVTWSLLEQRFGLRQGEPNSPEALVAAVEFLSAWRKVVAAREVAEREFRLASRRLGLPQAREKPHPSQPSRTKHCYAAFIDQSKFNSVERTYHREP
jgi:hypothetical protein